MLRIAARTALFGRVAHARGTQAIWPSEEVHCPEHVCGVRDAMLFDRLGEQCVGVVHAARLLLPHCYR